MRLGQRDRTLAMITHALVALTGMSGLLFLTPLLFAIPVASVVLAFVWRSGSPFVARHARQAAAMQVFVLLAFLLLTILARMTAPLEGTAPDGILIRVTGGLAVALCFFAATVGILGLLKAREGEDYCYPITGRWIDRRGP